MADRQTMNVSLPPAQEQFVRAQVGAGRYRSASEVVREGLRMLEEHEHARLVEKWLYEGLSPEEEGQLRPELLARAREHIRNLVDMGTRDRDAGRVSDGPIAMDRVNQNLRARIKSA
jgi:antitoxin ParD1/3/4